LKANQETIKVDTKVEIQSVINALMKRVLNKVLVSGRQVQS
jgi:hypothetical protein